MQSKEGTSIDAVDWQFRRPAPPGSGRRSRARWRWLVLAIVVLAHALAGLLASLRDTERKGRAQHDDALVVSFIDRAPAPMPTLTLMQQVVDRPVRESSVGPRFLPPAKEKAGVVPTSPTDSDSPLRLHIQPDPWNPDASAFTRNALDKPVVAIPARSETALSRIRFYTSSPEQKLEMIGALFGAIKHKPCQPARDRLANLHSTMNEIDLAADLRTRELYCGP